jgi:hypothetical protein
MSLDRVRESSPRILLASWSVFRPELHWKVMIAATTVVVLSVLFLFGWRGPQETFALEITDAFNSERNFGPNPLGLSTGAELVFGASKITPSGSPTQATATQGSVTVPLVFSPSAAIPDDYVGNVPFSSALTGAWSITATRGIEAAGPVLTNTIPNPQVLPLVENLQVIGTGFTPTLVWTLPNLSGFVANLSLVTAWSADTPNPTSQAIFNLLTVQDHFTIPTGTLEFGRRYVFAVTLGEFQQSLGLVNDSETFTQKTYTPMPANLILPTVESGPVFRFNTEVGFVRVFIDPVVANGYKYEVGAGDPNFATVVFPSVGGGKFELFRCDGSSLGPVNAGTVFSFGPGGIGCFRVSGIDVSAALDPNDPTAFPTGLTFTANGPFTGTMTPLTVDRTPTPEPTSLLLLGTTAGGLGLVWWQRRKRLSPDS